MNKILIAMGAVYFGAVILANAAESGKTTQGPEKAAKPAAVAHIDGDMQEVLDARVAQSQGHRKARSCGSTCTAYDSGRRDGDP